jgi:hypothetical protein
MAWGLSLADLREIANNSIRHSSVSEPTKTLGYAKFQRQWDEFINQTYAQICNENKINQMGAFQVNITNLHPSYGPNEFRNRLLFLYD